MGLEGEEASSQCSAGGQGQPVPLSGPQSSILVRESQNSPRDSRGPGKVSMKPIFLSTAWQQGTTSSVSLSPMPPAQEGPIRASGRWAWWVTGKHHSLCTVGPLWHCLEPPCLSGMPPSLDRKGEELLAVFGWRTVLTAGQVGPLPAPLS